MRITASQEMEFRRSEEGRNLLARLKDEVARELAESKPRVWFPACVLRFCIDVKGRRRFERRLKELFPLDRLG